MAATTKTPVLAQTEGVKATRQTSFILPPVHWVRTGLVDVTAPTSVNVSGLISGETYRAAVALESHTAMVKEVSGSWKGIPATHEHPQLLTESDD